MRQFGLILILSVAVCVSAWAEVPGGLLKNGERSTKLHEVARKGSDVRVASYDFVDRLVLPETRPPISQHPASAATPQPGSQDPDVVSISVNLVQVDGTVTDKEGQQVTDLKKEDFELLVDGRRQDISNFSYVPAQANAGSARSGDPKSGPSAQPEVPGPASRLRPEQVRRTVALVIGNVSFDGLRDVKKALRKFVDEQMQPGDLVAIVLLAQRGILQQFTSDKRLLHRAIDVVRWHPLTGTEVSAVAQPGDSGPTADADAAQATLGAEDFFQDLVANKRLQQFELIVGGLESLPGRKSIIFFSDGFQLFSRSQDNRRTLETAQRLTDRATRALVVFYTIDARGLQPLMNDASAKMDMDQPAGIGTPLKVQRTRTGADYAVARQGMIRNFTQLQDGLAYLADQTGGRFIQSTDLSGAISRTLDQKGYYLIGYRPDNLTFKLDAGRRPYHRIEVKVKRQQLHAHFRKGFYGTPDKQPAPAADNSVQRMAAALTSPFDSSDINLRLTTLFGHDKQDGSFIRTLLHVDVHDLTFVEEADGRLKAEMSVVAATFTERGLLGNPIERRQAIRVLPRNIEQAKRDGVVYEMTMPVDRAGIYQMRLAVRDTESERFGTASQFIEVPNISENRLALSGIVISAKPMATPAGTAAAVPPNANNSQADDSAILSGPAVRKFRKGMQVSYAFLILGAKHDPGRGPQVETQAVLYRNGQVVFKGAARPVPVGQDPNELLSTGSLNLGKDLDAGEYILQIVVTDKLAKDENYRTATQWIDFDVSG